MKKYLILFVVLLLSFTVVGCDFFTTTTTDGATSSETTQTTTITDTTLDTTTVTTTTSSTTSTTTNTTTSTTTTEVTTTISEYVQLNPGVDTVEINTEWIDAGAVVIIGDNQFDMTASGAVDIATLGTYLISYTYEDYIIQRMVIVVDTIAPVITLNPGIDTIHLNDEWIDAGVQVTDNSLGEVTVEISGMVITTETGTYAITYTATDESGNSTSLTRYVTVIEKMQP